MSENCKPIDFGELVADFNAAKHQSEYIAGLFLHSNIFHNRALKMQACGTFIGLDESEDARGYRVSSANFCRQRLCPMCQRRRALRTFAAMSQVADLAAEEGYVFLHLVLTVPNCPGNRLGAAIDKLYRCSSLLFRKQLDAHVLAAIGDSTELRQIRASIGRAFAGVFRALEVTHKEGAAVDDPNAFHPHLHCLVAVRKSYFKSRAYVKYDNLRAVWAQLIGVANPQLYISKVTEKSSAIAEVAKYCVKPFGNNVDFDVLDALQRHLHGRRMTQAYGTIKTWLRALKIDLEREEEFDPQNVPQILLRYDGVAYRRERAIIGGGDVVCETLQFPES